MNWALDLAKSWAIFKQLQSDKKNDNLAIGNFSKIGNLVNFQIILRKPIVIFQIAIIAICKNWKSWNHKILLK